MQPQDPFEVPGTAHRQHGRGDTSASLLLGRYCRHRRHHDMALRRDRLDGSYAQKVFYLTRSPSHRHRPQRGVKCLTTTIVSTDSQPNVSGTQLRDVIEEAGTNSARSSEGGRGEV